MLRPHAEAIGWMLFPQARKAGGFLCIGSIHGEPGDSLKITLRGPKAGSWADYAMSPNEPLAKGDLLKLLQHTVGGGDLGRGVAEAKRYLNLDSMDPRALERVRERAVKARAKSEAEQAGHDEKRRRQSEGLWQSAAQSTPSSPPVRYLQGRGIDFAVLGRLPGAIRFHPRVWHGELRREVPAMVTKFTALDGSHAATHVTFLEYSNGVWRKLQGVEASKQIHCGLYWGAHIPLWKGRWRGKLADLPAGTPVEVSEGIEDGLSYAMANPDARIVAAGTLGNIGAMLLPAQAGQLTILAQRDSKPEPIAALEAAIKAQQQRARGAGIERAVACRWPPEGIKDWNDWLRADAGGGVE